MTSCEFFQGSGEVREISRLVGCARVPCLCVNGNLEELMDILAERLITMISQFLFVAVRAAILAEGLVLEEDIKSA